MTTYTWRGGDGQFSSINWEVSGTPVVATPGGLDSVLIAAPGTYAVSAANATVTSITVTDPNATLVLGGNCTVGVDSGNNLLLNGITIDGTLGLSGGTITVGAWKNFNGAKFANGVLLSTGVVNIGPGTYLHVIGATYSATIADMVGTGATIVVDGYVGNDGQTITPSSFAGNAVVIHGTLTGGTIDSTLPFIGLSDPATDPYINRVPVLDGVTVVGALEASADWIAAGAFRVVAADGVSPGTLSVDVGQPLLVSNATLDGFTIAITGSGQSGGISFTGTTTLGPNLAIVPDASVPGMGVSDTFGTSLRPTEDMLINQATITASIYLGFQAVHFVNEGVITNLGTWMPIGVVEAISQNSPSSIVNTGSLFSVNGTLEIYNYIYSSNRRDFISLPFTNSGLVAVSGGTLAIDAGVTGDGTIAIANGSTAHIRDGYDHQTFGFIGTGNTLSLESIGGSNVVLGFAPGDTLDLSQPALSGSYADGVLAIEQIGHPFASFIMGGAPANAQFSIVQDPNNHHTYITETIPCFAAGTRIGTPRGEVPVEQLRVGDQVLSGFGGTVPIVWIGRRTLWPPRSPDPASLWPVRICAGALGGGIPARDLLVSAEHAIYLDGVLVPAGLLLNGHGIVRAPCREITYLHVELPQHDLLLAEGAACESYLDTGNRADFGGAVVAMHPSFGETPNAIWLARACAPQCRSGPLLAAIRARLDRPAGNAAGAKA